MTWVRTTWSTVYLGARVCPPDMPKHEDIVQTVTPLPWHVDPESNPRWPRPLEHWNLAVTLAARGKMYMRPDAEVDIWEEPVDVEVMAIVALMNVFDVDKVE